MCGGSKNKLVRRKRTFGIWVSGPAGVDRMPMWCPPTPPSGDGDVYCESWSRALYRAGAAPDALLPPVHRREPRAAREPRRPRPPPRAPHAPPSLFERAGARPRPRPRSSAHAHGHAGGAHAHAAQAEWSAGEDAALRRALRLQRLPAEPPAALQPNWEWASEVVEEAARAYRSPRACRDRHDALADPERARRKHRRGTARRRLDEDAPRPPLARLEAMREAADTRRAAPKRRLDDAPQPNPKHAALLADHGVDYDAPPSPMDVATRRADRIAKEKMKAGGAAPAAAAPAVTASAPVPQRVVVAAHAPPKAEPRRARPDPPRPAAPAPPAQLAHVAHVTHAAPAAQQPAQLLYRQQTLATRHHLKILHHTAATHAQAGGTVTSISEAGVASAPALRTLQLQQLALRRAPPASSAASAAPPRLLPAAAARPHHVVLTHLAPAPLVTQSASPSTASTPASTAPAPQPPQRQ